MAMTARWFVAFVILSLVSGSSALLADDAAESLDGVWAAQTAELAGVPFPEEIRKSIRLEIKGENYSVLVGKKPDKGTCKVDAKAKPKTLDITGTEGPNKGKTILAIYERDGEKLRVCYDLSGKTRPAEFRTVANSTLFLVEYKLQKE